MLAQHLHFYDLRVHLSSELRGLSNPDASYGNVSQPIQVSVQSGQSPIAYRRSLTMTGRLCYPLQSFLQSDRFEWPGFLFLNY